MHLHLRLVPAVAAEAALAAPAAAPNDYRFGDVSRVDVAVLLDGEQVGGFSAELSSPKIFLPVVIR
jgi:hypothetical protein